MFYFPIKNCLCTVCCCYSSGYGLGFRVSIHRMFSRIVSYYSSSHGLFNILYLTSVCVSMLGVGYSASLEPQQHICNLRPFTDPLGTHGWQRPYFQTVEIHDLLPWRTATTWIKAQMWIRPRSWTFYSMDITCEYRLGTALWLFIIHYSPPPDRGKEGREGSLRIF